MSTTNEDTTTRAKRHTTRLIVQSGQYEQAAKIITVRHSTTAGLMRRARQLSFEHAVYGDNWVGWLRASIAIVDPCDTWTRNKIVGGSSCDPAKGWLDLE